MTKYLIQSARNPMNYVQEYERILEDGSRERCWQWSKIGGSTEYDSITDAHWAAGVLGLVDVRVESIDIPEPMIVE